MKCEERYHAHQSSRFSTGNHHTGEGKYFRHDGIPCHAPGYPAAGCADPESDAYQDRDRDPASAQTVQHTAAGQCGVPADRQLCAAAYRFQSSGILLHYLRSGKRPEIRRHDHHRRAFGLCEIRGCHLLG